MERWEQLAAEAEATPAPRTMTAETGVTLSVRAQETTRASSTAKRAKPAARAASTPRRTQRAQREKFLYLLAALCLLLGAAMQFVFTAVRFTGFLFW